MRVIVIEPKENWKKNNLLSDIFSLRDFFTEIIKPRYEILTLEQDEFSFLSRMNVILPITEFMVNKYKGFTSIPEIFKHANNFIKETLDKEEPFFTPLGFNLDKEKHFAFVLDALYYHLEKQALSLVKLVLKGILPDEEINKSLKENIPRFNFPARIKGLEDSQLDFIKQIFNLLLGEINIYDDFISFIPEIVGFAEPELYITEYANSFDLIFSFIAEPLESAELKTETKRAKEVVNRILSKIDSKYHYYFEELDPQLRNAFIHKSYRIDETTEEICYFSRYYDKKTKITDFKTISFRELSSKTLKLKISLVSLLQASLLHFMRFSKELSEEILPYALLWKPEISFDWSEQIFGISFTDIKYTEFFHKKNLRLESVLLELKIMMKPWEEMKKSDLGFFKFEPNIVSAEDKLDAFWKAIIEDEELFREISTIFGFYLALLSVDKNYENNLIGVEKYIKIVQPKLEKQIKERTYLETYLALLSIDEKNAIKFLKKAMFERSKSKKETIEVKTFTELLKNERNAKEVLNKIPKELIPIFIISKICRKVSLLEIIRSFSLFELSKLCIEQIWNILPQAAKLLIEELVVEDKALTGSQLAQRIRLIEPSWPLPDFTNVKNCITLVHKLKLVEVGKKGSDRIVNLRTKFKAKLVELVNKEQSIINSK